MVNRLREERGHGLDVHTATVGADESNDLVDVGIVEARYRRIFPNPQWC